MDPLSVMDIINSRITTVDEFNFDRLTARPLHSMLNPLDIAELEKIARSVKYAGKLKLKQQKINDIMHARGFRKLSAGTNRICYTYYEDPTIVVKVAIDDVGASDNPREFINQQKLKPFVAKCFEISPNGAIGVFERVNPITNREEFATLASSVYDMYDHITNGYVMADIGTKYFMNVGVRNNFGVVLLDYPYLYELDVNKLFCKVPKHDCIGGICGGVIDYDFGFNELLCTKCGARYKAMELAKEQDDIKSMVTRGTRKGNIKMKIGVVTNGKKQVLNDNNGMKDSVTAIPKPSVQPAPKVGVKVNVNTSRTNSVKVQPTTQNTVQPKPQVQQTVKPQQPQTQAQTTEQKPKQPVNITAISFDNLAKLIFRYKGKADGIGEFVAASDNIDIIVHADMRTIPTTPAVNTEADNEDLERAKNDLLVQEERNETQRQKIEELEEQLANLANNLEIAEDKLNTQHPVEDIAAYQNKIKELEMKNADLAAKIAVLESINEKAEEIEQTIEEYTEATEEEIEELQAELEEPEEEENGVLRIEACGAGIYNLEDIAELLRETFPDTEIDCPEDIKNKKVICIKPEGEHGIWVDRDNNIKCIGFINGYPLDDITISAKAPALSESSEDEEYDQEDDTIEQDGDVDEIDEEVEETEE